MKYLSIRTLDFIIYCCMFTKAFCPFLGLAYLVGWLTMVFEDPVFYLINDIIGWLPNLIDGIFLHQTDLFGSEYPMGYIYSAALTIILMYIVFKIQIYAGDCKIIKENETKKIEIKKIKRMNKTQEKVKKDSYKYFCFFGLLELNLEYEDKYGKTGEELEKLKNEYLKMLTNKLSEKYSNVKFELSDKVFINSNDFLIFDPLLLDISKLHKIFVDLDNQKAIKTELILSFACANTNDEVEYIKKVLQKINNLKYINKVIVINDFYSKYKEMKAQHFEFISLGLSRIEMSDFKEIDVDLYCLKKNQL